MPAGPAPTMATRTGRVIRCWSLERADAGSAAQGKGKAGLTVLHGTPYPVPGRNFGAVRPTRRPGPPCGARNGLKCTRVARGEDSPDRAGFARRIGQMMAE